MVYDVVGKTITAVEWQDSTVATFTLDDGTAIEAHHIKILTPDVQIATIEAEVQKMEETLALKTAKLDVLKGTVVVIKDPKELDMGTEVVGNPPLDI